MADIMLGQLLHRPTIDPISGDSPLPVQLSGRKVKIQIDTLVNAASVAASGKVTADLGAQGESELMLLVSTDKQPWRVVAGHPWYPNGDALGTSTTIYPSGDRTTTHTAVNPASLLYIGRVLTGVTVESLAEAVAMQMPPVSGVSMRFSNLSAETATVTIKALRIWR
jgi:hypothetical protein